MAAHNRIWTGIAALLCAALLAGCGGSQSGFTKGDLPKITAVRPPRPGGLNYLPAQAPKPIKLDELFNTTYSTEADQDALRAIKDAGFVDAYRATWTGLNTATVFAFLLKKEPRAPHVLASLHKAFQKDFERAKIKPVGAPGLGARAWGEHTPQGDYVYGFRKRNLVVVVTMSHGKRNPTEDEAVRYAQAISDEAKKQES